MSSMHPNVSQVRFQIGGVAAGAFSNELAPAPNLEVVPVVVPVRYERVRITEICLISDLGAAANDLIMHFFDRATGNLIGTLYQNTHWQGYVMFPAPTLLPWNVGAGAVYGYYLRDLSIDIPVYQDMNQTEMNMGIVLYNGNIVQAGFMECILKYEKVGR